MSRVAGAERGFTLLELLVVSILLGLALLVVAPRFRPQESASARAEAEIARVLAELRARAIDRARIEPVDPEQLSRSTGLSLALESGDQTKFYFYPDGTASNTTLVLVDPSGRRIRLDIESLTGRIIRARE